MDQKLQDAIDYINSVRRNSNDPPLVVMAICNMCGHEHAKQPQDFNRAVEHNHPHICSFCRPEYRRQKNKSYKK